jgi:amidase
MWCKGLSIEQQQTALQQQQVIKQYINTIFESHDLILLPTTPGRSPLLGQSASTMAAYREDLVSLTSIAGLSGRPQIHLPLFTIEGAPCGLSLIGNKHTDLFLILLASELIKQSESFTLAKHTL